MLTRDDILKADDRKVVDVDVPEWGGPVRLRALSGRQRAEFDAVRARILEAGSKDYGDILMCLLVRSMVDEDGELLFTDDDADALGEKLHGALDRLFDAAMELNGLSERAIDDAVGNSDGDRSPGSGTS
jgi:hypothetical protein